MLPVHEYSTAVAGTDYANVEPGVAAIRIHCWCLLKGRFQKQEPMKILVNMHRTWHETKAYPFENVDSIEHEILATGKKKDIRCDVLE